MEKIFNLIINGVGGQGVITLLAIIDQAAFFEGYDVRSSELHGLSQRGGSVEAHIRFGKKVYSPLVANGQADLIIALEMLEGFRESSKSGKLAKFLINDFISPFQGSPSKEEIKLKLNLLPNEIYIVAASENCKQKLQKEIVSSVYLLGYAIAKKIIPISKNSVIRAINMMPEKNKEININAFNLGFNNDK